MPTQNEIDMLRAADSLQPVTGQDSLYGLCNSHTDTRTTCDLLLIRVNCLLPRDGLL